jgi:hypothetical protein
MRAGLADHPGVHFGSPHRLSSQEVRELLRSGGFREHQIHVRTFIAHARAVDDVLASSRASSFGNDLSTLTEAEIRQVREELAIELERFRDEQGIRLERHIIFAIAEKEASNS